jgi:hypothetical protein
MLRISMNATLALGVLIVGSSARAEVPDLDLSSAVIADGGAGAVLLIHPHGVGNSFTAARLVDGSVVDATITATLRYGDSPGLPLVGYAAEDLWLETSGHTLGFLVGGTIADGPTDASGQTHWSDPLFAGGATFGETVVVMTASGALTQPGLELEFVSVDINGDVAVNLADVTFFSVGYFNQYDETVDLWYDGVNNLSDVAIFAQMYFL